MGAGVDGRAPTISSSTAATRHDAEPQERRRQRSWRPGGHVRVVDRQLPARGRGVLSSATPGCGLSVPIWFHITISGYGHDGTAASKPGYDLRLQASSA